MGSSLLSSKPANKRYLKDHIGFMVNSMSFSQLSVCLSNALNMSPNIASTVFFEVPGSPNYICNFAQMDVCYAWDYQGVLVATNLSTANKLIHVPCSKQRFFYIWDLEWIRLPNKNYSQLQNVYGHPSLKLLCRSKDHQDAIRSAWNKEAIIVDDFDMTAIKKECLGI